MESQHDRWSKVTNFIYSLPKKPIVVGVSGGIDSMALVHYLFQLDWQIYVIHVNYHQRAKESDADQKLVEEYCVKHKIPYEVHHYHNQHKGNFQNEARIFRRNILTNKAQQINAYVALAHHADDQIETFYMNLMRASGITGLAAMPQHHQQIIRPFLHLFKEDIYDYTKKQKIVWREDASNLTAKYLRNKWRLEFIPKMLETNIKLKEQTLLLIDKFQATLLEIQNQVANLTATMERENMIESKQIQDLTPEAQFELWRQLKQPVATFSRFQELLNIDHGKKIILHHPWNYATRKNDIIYLHKEQQLQPPTIQVEQIQELPTNYNKDCVFLDSNKLKGELSVRTWQEGDKIASIGVKGKQLVSKIIKDAKIPLTQRKSILVVHDTQNIHWVVGLKVGRYAIASNTSSKILKISLKYEDK